MTGFGLHDPVWTSVAVFCELRLHSDAHGRNLWNQAIRPGPGLCHHIFGYAGESDEHVAPDGIQRKPHTQRRNKTVQSRGTPCHSRRFSHHSGTTAFYIIFINYA